MVLHRRNISCIGCGCPRSSEQGGQFGVQQQHLQSCSSVSSGSKVAPSPRFNAPPNSNNVYYSSGPLPSQPSHHLPPPTPQHQPPPQSTNTHSIRTSNTFSHPRISPAAQKPSSPLPNLHLPNTHGHNPIQIGTAPGHAHESTSSHSHVPSQPPKLTHPLLTPSGRAFAVGGKVQNVSSDPLSPCIMYWPDNEPFPEQGQIRPSGLVGVAVRFQLFALLRLPLATIVPIVSILLYYFLFFDFKHLLLTPHLFHRRIATAHLKHRESRSDFSRMWSFFVSRNILVPVEISNANALSFFLATRRLDLPKV